MSVTKQDRGKKDLSAAKIHRQQRGPHILIE